MQSVDMHYSISSVEGWSSELRNTSNTFILHNRFSKYSCNCFKRSFHEHKDHILSFSLCKIHFESNEKEKSVDKHMFFIMIFFLQDLITLVREDILQIQLLCQWFLGLWCDSNFNRLVNMCIKKTDHSMD